MFLYERVSLLHMHSHTLQQLFPNLVQLPWKIFPLANRNLRENTQYNKHTAMLKSIGKDFQTFCLAQPVPSSSRIKVGKLSCLKRSH